MATMELAAAGSGGQVLDQMPQSRRRQGQEEAAPSQAGARSALVLLPASGYLAPGLLLG
uniref:Uncharacterized protein n=1 Tax=Triticum urartu TaxID=4572 RepID=A0A8R7P8X6_TRIUA